MTETDNDVRPLFSNEKQDAVHSCEDDCDTEPDNWSSHARLCYPKLPDNDDLPEGMRTPSSVGDWEGVQTFAAKGPPENDSEQSKEDFELQHLQKELERLQEENKEDQEKSFAVRISSS